ncbi:MAG: hypothetical protein LBM19_04350 [Holosporales bacterium]|jgi:hypothetical protein|nr:hypothetical protein [Holosporales bacterium]
MTARILRKAAVVTNNLRRRKFASLTVLIRKFKNGFGGRNLEGFSLIEISRVLLIIGIIAGGMLKGRDLIAAAQVKSVASDIQVLQIAYAQYVNSYGALPGDDNSAASRFGAVANGDGDGKISSGDAKKVFAHLYAAGLIESANFKIPKIGGTYDVISEGDVAKLRISDKGRAFVTGRQLITLLAKTNELLGEHRGKLETEPTEISRDDSQKYIVKIRLD